jgi:hypothetical protein
MAIQSILFDRAYYTEKSSRDWLVRHGYKTYKVDITGKYYRWRQFDPSEFKHYRTINFGNHIKAILELNTRNILQLL